MLDKKRFYLSIKPQLFKGKLSQVQVTNMEGIIDYATGRGVTVRQLAYILATCYHETAHTMRPVEEYGRGHGRPYGGMLDITSTGAHVPYSTPNQVYYGRGYVQLTWLTNYRSMAKLLGVDLVYHPELALDPAIATKILVEGMIRGSFTGKNLSDYFTATASDPVHARRVINGMDCAPLIAGYYNSFLHALTIV